MVALAPPTDTSVGLTLVNGCTDTTNDSGLVMVTNNSSEPISDIHVDGSGLSGATITNPAFSEDNNVYCNGQQLAPNGYCEFRASSGTNATGEIDIYGHLVTSHSTSHHYELQAKVINTASPFNYALGQQPAGYGIIVLATASCNLVETATATYNQTSDHSWSSAIGFCGVPSHIPDVGPTPVYSSSSSSTLTGEMLPVISAGEFGFFINGSPEYIWQSPFSSLAWQATLQENPENPGTVGSSSMSAVNKGSSPNPLHMFCISSFTTNADGS
jgi:hypothetical protein